MKQIYLQTFCAVLLMALTLFSTQGKAKDTTPGAMCSKSCDESFRGCTNACAGFKDPVCQSWCDLEHHRCDHRCRERK